MTLQRWLHDYATGIAGGNLSESNGRPRNGHVHIVSASMKKHHDALA